MVQRLPVIRADEVDHAAPVALVDSLTIIGNRIFVPDRMAEGHVQPIDRPAVSVDEVGDLLPIADLLQPPKGVAFAHFNRCQTRARSPDRSSTRVRAVLPPNSARNP